MKNVLLLLAVLFATLPSASAAVDIRALADKMAVSRVSFAYSYEAVRDGTRMKGGGRAVVQGDAFRMEADGLEIVSDGTVRWTADTDAQELYIEPVDASATDFVSNPARLLANVDKAFRVDSMSRGTFRGQPADVYVLTPSVSGTGIRRVELCFSGRTLVGASVTVKDGMTTDFMVSDLTFSDPGPAEDFRFDVKKAGNGWVVTDLR